MKIVFLFLGIHSRPWGKRIEVGDRQTCMFARKSEEGLKMLTLGGKNNNLFMQTLSPSGRLDFLFRLNLYQLKCYGTYWNPLVSFSVLVIDRENPLRGYCSCLWQWFWWLWSVSARPFIHLPHVHFPGWETICGWWSVLFIHCVDIQHTYTRLLDLYQTNLIRYISILLSMF